MPKTTLIHGPSGSGKDTQVDLLKGKFEYEKIGTGEMFRGLISSGDEKYSGIKKSINNGEFVPSEITYSLLDDWLKSHDVDKDWIFVSVVRISEQIELFDQLLDKYKRNLDLFIHFKLSQEDAIERMSLRRVCVKCGRVYHDKYNRERNLGVCNDDGGELKQREDDKIESIRKRLDEYNKTIAPILKVYNGRGILVEIDASPSIQEINKEVLKVLNLL